MNLCWVCSFLLSTQLKNSICISFSHSLYNMVYNVLHFMGQTTNHFKLSWLRYVRLKCQSLIAILLNFSDMPGKHQKKLHRTLKNMESE
jgi:hypothetical protein